MFDVITIGTATRDIFLTSPLFKVLRDPAHLKKIGFKTAEAQCFALGGKIEISKPILTTGGGATNAAVTFSRQGFKTAALIKIGEDQAGKDILDELVREKITTLKLQTNNNGTAHSTILLAPSGERTILVYRGASEDLKLKEIPFDKLKAKWLYISPGRISFETVKKVIDYAAGRKIPVAFNPSQYFIDLGIKKLKPILMKSKAVILNREEASCLTKADYENSKEIFKRLDKVVAGLAVMTDGPRGAMVSDGFNIYQAKGFEGKKVIDRTGAGDAFGSGFVSGLIQKRDIKYAIRLGMANAASVVEYIGTKEGILTKKEFEKSKRWQHLPIKISKLTHYEII